MRHHCPGDYKIGIRRKCKKRFIIIKITETAIAQCSGEGHFPIAPPAAALLQQQGAQASRLQKYLP